MKKIKIIPAINTENFEEVKKKINILEKIGYRIANLEWVHLDAADGTFTKNTIWHNSEDLIGFKTFLNIEAHLMVAKPEERIESWLIQNIKRIIFNLESSEAPDFVIEKCRENGIETGISIGPDIPWTRVQPFLDKIDVVQILAVRPGFAGQKFIKDVLDKIKHLRNICPKCDIEVDGGINPETAKKAKEAGANIFISASYIFGGDVRERIENLKKNVLS